MQGILKVSLKVSSHLSDDRDQKVFAETKSNDSFPAQLLGFTFLLFADAP